MHRLRTFALKRCWAMAALLVAALAMRVLVPAGFMPDFTGGTIALAFCPGAEPAVMPAAASVHDMAHAKPGAHGSAHQHSPQQTASPCTFADLSLPVLGGMGPLLLAAMLSFVAVLALLRAPLSLSGAPTRLLPPLRGPPLQA